VIRIAFDPTTLTGDQAVWWENWEKRATRATATLREQVEAKEELRFNSRIWLDLKEWLLKQVFQKNCAYCEGEVLAQSFGDADHWRPKSAVTERCESGRSEAIERDGRKHPGYWWLAYDWSNLLPACQRCNSGGKGTQFPVAREHVFEPAGGESAEELDGHEEPLLLHPFRGEDPLDHLAFDELGGVHPVGDSSYGKTSIAVFRLDRGDLVEKRLEYLGDLKEKVKSTAHDALVLRCSFEKAAGNKFKRMEYSAAALPYMARLREENRKSM
jgi:hypothetical protein